MIVRKEIKVFEMHNNTEYAIERDIVDIATNLIDRQGIPVCAFPKDILEDSEYPCIVMAFPIGVIEDVVKIDDRSIYANVQFWSEQVDKTGVDINNTNIKSISFKADKFYIPSRKLTIDDIDCITIE